MKNFLPLCTAALLLAVSLPLSAAPTTDRDAALRDEMETQFQHLERKLSLQVEDAALATARQERRLTELEADQKQQLIELENELKQLREERKKWLNDAQNPIIALAEKKKEEVRETGERYVSMVGAGFTWVGALAAIVAIVPGVFSIISALLFNINAKQKIKEINEMRENIIEVNRDLVKRVKEFKNRYQDVFNDYIEEMNKNIEKYEKGHNKLACIIDDVNTLVNDTIQKTTSKETCNSLELYIKAIELIQKAKHLESHNIDPLDSDENLEQKQINDKQTSSTERAALYSKAEQLLLQANELTPQSTDIIATLLALKFEQAKDATPDDQKIFLVAAEKYIDALLQQEHAKSLYNRACIAAQRGQPERALDLLEECRQAEMLPPREHLEKDKDMDSLRDLEAFKEFLKRAYSEEDTRETDSPAGDSE